MIRSPRIFAYTAAATLLLGSHSVWDTAAHAQGFVRMEVIPVASVTLTTQQILSGETSGKPAIVAGQLRIPKAGTDKLPAIVSGAWFRRLECLA